MLIEGHFSIIARRAAYELEANSVINLGIGMPEGIASVANEEKILDYIALSVTRYTTTGAFFRIKLGDALTNRQVAPHVYENSEEAQHALAAPTISSSFTVA